MKKLIVFILPALALLLTACGGTSDAELVSTAVAQLSTEQASVATETSVPLPAETATDEARSAEFIYYTTEFETRFAALEESYAAFTLLYNIGREDSSIMGDRTWKENVNAALDEFYEDANYLARTFPVPDELLELHMLVGNTIDTGTYFFALQYRDGINSLDPTVLDEAHARYGGIRTHMDEALALFHQLTGQ
jgi:hypothetical protein